MADAVTYGRVLIGGLPFREYRTAEGQRGFAADGSALPYIVEELIARSAIQVAVSKETNAASAVQYLSPLLRDRVLVVENAQAARLRDTFLAPVLMEFGADVRESGAIGFAESTDERLRHGVAAIFFVTETFFLGMLHRLQIDIDLEGIRQAARVLRGAARNPDARVCLAVLEGILGSYKLSEIPRLVSAPANRPHLVEMFHRLVNDSAYLQASEGAGGLGFPDRVQRSIEFTRRGLRGILENRGFKLLFNLGAKTVATATHMELPDSETARELLERGFLPPVASIAEVLDGALNLWREQNPPLIHPDPKVPVVSWNDPTDDGEHK